MFHSIHNRQQATQVVLQPPHGQLGLKFWWHPSFFGNSVGKVAFWMRWCNEFRIQNVTPHSKVGWWLVSFLLNPNTWGKQTVQGGHWSLNHVGVMRNLVSVTQNRTISMLILKKTCQLKKIKVEMLFCNIGCVSKLPLNYPWGVQKWSRKTFWNSGLWLHLPKRLLCKTGFM